MIRILRAAHWAASFFGRNRITDRISGAYYDECVKRFMLRKAEAEYAAETARQTIDAMRTGDPEFVCLAGDGPKADVDPADWELHSDVPEDMRQCWGKVVDS